MTGTSNAIVICVDSSDFMLNEDYLPSRWVAQHQAVTWLLQELASSNTCTVVGIKGGRPTVLGSTSGTSGIRAVLNPPLPSSPFSCGCSHRNPYGLLPSLQLAQLVLRNRKGGRIVAFCGSPINDDEQQLQSTAAFYRKNNIAFDVISFGDGDSDMWERVKCRLSVCPSDGPSMADTIGLLRWDAHQEESPPLLNAAQSNVPLLRMPPPSRVCRRGVVDSTKVSAHSLSPSLMFSLSFPSLSGSPARDRVVLMVAVPPQRNKKILVEFRAGRCQVVAHEVRPLRKKGHLAVLQVHDNLLQFIWRDRATNQAVLDVSVHKGEASFQRVPLHTTRGRVYYLHIFDTNRKHFFWMQHPNEQQDPVYCATIREFLAGPPPPPPSSHHLDPADVQHLLATYRNSSIPLLPTSPSSSSSSSSTPSSSSSNNPFSEGSRKWITNPTWMPPLLPRRLPSSSSLDRLSSTFDRSVSSSLDRSLSSLERSLTRRSVQQVSPVRVPAAVCAGSGEPALDLTQTLTATPSPTTSSSAMPELERIGTSPDTSISPAISPIPPPTSLSEQGPPLEPPPSPPHERRK